MHKRAVDTRRIGEVCCLDRKDLGAGRRGEQQGGCGQRGQHCDGGAHGCRVRAWLRRDRTNITRSFCCMELVYVLRLASRDRSGAARLYVGRAGDVERRGRGTAPAGTLRGGAAAGGGERLSRGAARARHVGDARDAGADARRHDNVRGYSGRTRGRWGATPAWWCARWRWGRRTCAGAAAARATSARTTARRPQPWLADIRRRQRRPSASAGAAGARGGGAADPAPARRRPTGAAHAQRPTLRRRAARLRDRGSRGVAAGADCSSRAARWRRSTRGYAAAAAGLWVRPRTPVASGPESVRPK